jgi:hypothetical protein
MKENMHASKFPFLKRGREREGVSAKIHTGRPLLSPPPLLKF